MLIGTLLCTKCYERVIALMRYAACANHNQSKWMWCFFLLLFDLGKICWFTNWLGFCANRRFANHTRLNRTVIFSVALSIQFDMHSGKNCMIFLYFWVTVGNFGEFGRFILLVDHECERKTNIYHSLALCKLICKWKINEENFISS